MWESIRLKFCSYQMSSKSYAGFREPLVLLFLMLLTVEDRHAFASQMDDCPLQRCGNINISYPFWMNGKQQSFCGFPPFNITCSSSEDNKTEIPILTILGFELHVKNIFYNNKSIHLVNPRYGETCYLPQANFSSELYPYTLSSSNKKIFFLYNCTSSEDPHIYRNTGCVFLDKPVYFGGPYSGLAKLNSSDPTSTIVVAPVMEYNELSLDGNYTDWLMSGWLFNWTAVDCTECLNSGGQCGYNASTARFMCMCRDRNHERECAQGDSNERIAGAAEGESNKRIIIGAAAAASGGVITLACVIIIFIFFKYKKRQRTTTSRYSFRNSSNMNREMDVQLQIHLFSYNELMEATDGFDASRELGDGGYGAVYKGKLRDGRTVAIKRLYDRNCRRIKQFMNEVEILSRLHHQNLVSLYGCTSYHSHDLLLVYEYIQNGTVADHLHGSRASERILTWPMRLNIAIETADALTYLHAVEPPIIHRDVKTNNILLDSSFHVKVADFGLSRLFPHDATHVSTAPQGTPGYVDPEYHQCFQLTDKSDVYSFGVVLVELISSKPAIDIGRQRSEISLANMAITKIQNHELDDLIDSDLWYPDEGKKMMITMVAELAFRCLQSDGDMRPPIKEVLEGLQAVERSTNKADKKDKHDIWTQDDAGLIQNIAVFSPDVVAGKWVSKSTTPSTSQ